MVHAPYITHNHNNNNNTIMNPATTKIPKKSNSFKIMCQLVSDNNEEGQTLFDDWTPNNNPLHSWTRCLCGVRIYHQFSARNKKNGRELFPIGSSCIKQFQNKEANQIVDKAVRDYHKKKSSNKSNRNNQHQNHPHQWNKNQSSVAPLMAVIHVWRMTATSASTATAKCIGAIKKQ